MKSQRGSLTYGKQLELVAEFRKGSSLDEFLSTFSEQRSVIQSVLNRQPRQERLRSKRWKLSRLSLAENFCIAWRFGRKTVDIQLKFKMSPHTDCRILSGKDKLREHDSSRESKEWKRRIHPKYPQLESRVQEFISYARESRMPVSKNLTQEWVPMTPESLNISGF